MKGKNVFLAVIGLAMVCLMPVTASASLVVYSVDHADLSEVSAERAVWLSDLGIATPDTTIDFESGFSHDEIILGNLLDGGLTITSPNGYGYVTNDSADLGNSEPIGTYALAIDEGDAYAFTFDSVVTYASFYMMDHGATSLTINYVDGSSETISIPGGGASGYQGTFLALTSDAAISSLYIPNVEGGDGEVGMDNIEFGYIAPSSGAVPEPASMVLFGSGLVGFFVRRKNA